MAFGRGLLVPIALVSALACGCSNEAATQPAVTSSTVAVAEAPSDTADKAPSAAQLEAMLSRAVDPGIPARDKLDLVQGATEADAPLFDELVRLRQGNPRFTWHIGKPVLEQSGLAKAPVSGLMDGTNQTAYATLVFDGGWKLQRAYACDILIQVGRDTPSCH